MQAPGAPKWRGTYGGFLLCTRGSEVAVLEGVRLAASKPPDLVQPGIRTVSKKAIESAGGWTEPVAAMPGSPPSWSEPYAEGVGRMAGSYRSTVEGVRVSGSCADDYLTEGFDELMITLDVGREGALVEHFFIDYTANGRPYTLKVDWELGMCGRKVTPNCPRPSPNRSS